MIQRREPRAGGLVVLTGNGREHRYVANRLCQALPVDAVVVDASARQPSLRRAFRGGIRRGVARIAHFTFRKLVRDARARDRALGRVLGADATARFLAEDRVIRVDGINSAGARAAVAAASPSALLVFGTAIVRDEMLALADDMAFNMHTGLSPRYRGTDCAFWPVVNDELDWIGATVHECTSAVDGGQVFATGRAPCEPGDAVHEVFARAVARGADLYVDAIRRHLAGDLVGEPQDLSTGTEYRGYMRTLRPELRARRTLRRLRRQAPADRAIATRRAESSSARAVVTRQASAARAERSGASAWRELRVWGLALLDRPLRRQRPSRR